MKADQFSSALDKISDKYIEEACLYKAKAKSTAVRKWLAFAACIVLIISVFPIGISMKNSGWFDVSGSGPITTANTEESDPFAESTTGNEEITPEPLPSTPGLEYRVHPGGKTCTITGIGSCGNESEIVIGDTIDGYTVTEIDDQAFERTSTPGYYDVVNASIFTKITISKSVTHIGMAAFREKKIREVCYTGNIEDWCKISFGLQHSNPMFAGAKLYFEGELVTDIVIPDSITAIGQNQFEGCTSLKSVVIPEGVESIGFGAFSACRNLESISLPSTLSKIGSSAFENCYALKSIEIPSGVKEIPWCAFNSCRNLKSVTLPDGITSIGYKAFSDCSSLTKIDLPDSLTKIDDYALRCGVNEITIPNGVKSIGKDPFSKLTLVYYAGTVAEWKAIPKKDVSGEGVYLHSIQCTDGFFISGKPAEN